MSIQKGTNVSLLKCEAYTHVYDTENAPLRYHFSKVSTIEDQSIRLVFKLPIFHLENEKHRYSIFPYTNV